MTKRRRSPAGGGGRNGTCSCGSGTKAKRCCGLRRGPGSCDLARAFLADQAARASVSLLPFRRSRFIALFNQLVDVPALDVSLQLRLPAILSPELEALREAMEEEMDEEEDEERLEDLLAAAVDELDTYERRAELARAVLALRDAGRLDARLAAVAMVDLNIRSSALFESSLLVARRVRWCRPHAVRPGGRGAEAADPLATPVGRCRGIVRPARPCVGAVEDPNSGQRVATEVL